MKILFALYDLSGGGAERVTLDLVLQCKKYLPYQVDLLVYRFEGELINDKQLDKLTLVHDCSGSIKTFITVAKQYDLIVGSLEIKAHLLATIMKLFRKKTLLWLHKDMLYYLEHKPRLHKYLYYLSSRLLYSLANKVITVSEGCKKSFDKVYSFKKDKCSVIYNTIDFDRIDRAIEEEHLSHDIQAVLNSRGALEPIFVAVGRLTPQKGFDLLIDILGGLKEKGHKFKCIILGDGEQKQNFIEQIKKYSLQEEVLMPGYENPFPVIKKSDCFLMTSRYEGLPTVLIEALYLNKDIISFDCPSGPYELLSDTANVLVKEGDLSGFSNEVERYIVSFSASKTGKNTQEITQNKFSAEEISACWNKEFNKLL